MAYSHLDKQSRVLKEILEDGSIMEGAHIPPIMRIANILDLSSDTVSWEKLSKEEILEKIFQLIETMNGVVLLPAGHKSQVFDHAWNREYTMYRLSQKKDRLSELFSVRIKNLASLSDKHDLKIPFEWLNMLPDTEVEASLGEALICLHVNLHFDLLKELKVILRSQPRRASTNSRIIGTWTDNLPEHLLIKTPEFKRFFALRDQKVKGLGPV
ncbi:uncharacterized protein MELLADRAFT_110297 [Melampsora larici-populina 98AG31]|uniref:Uncharacterized protein n=1 Tax=Melampsora larici-populina (strain 98AG31 / pathotype 3-4-7) TaxID=747676 RepID=F4RZA9_MELLP|nr:uncharacterized protein MELLADRAFT_110297 [Melampsora larici-populina 98AG31]EGG02192.1 hypothetical protein MELLADRAFT_110297 [Melampsora larici-populina 98AG31]